MDALVIAIISLVTSLTPEQAQVHVDAATAAATVHADLTPELLLAVAFVESRYDARAVSRMECPSPDTCQRKTGAWPRDTQPPNSRPTFYCGPLQSGGFITWATCNRMRTDLAYGYDAGARELATWLANPRCRSRDQAQRIRCALAGHNAGNAGLANASKLPYVRWVLTTGERLRARAVRATRS